MIGSIGWAGVDEVAVICAVDLMVKITGDTDRDAVGAADGLPGAERRRNSIAVS
jgi:hypothetical protein